MISILMPVRNTAPYLEDCLKSILAQKEEDWELIAIDDHSKDGSFLILQEYQKKDSRIQVYQNDGTGIINALRLAYRKSSGELITRMDSDDLMTPDKLLELKTIVLTKGKGILATGLVKYISRKKLGDGYKRYEKWINQLSSSETNWLDLYKECVIPSPCWMVGRQDFEKSGAFSSNTYPEDYDLAFRFYQNGLHCISTSKIIHIWRDHSSRASRNDPNYSDNRFLDLKCKYFLKLHYQKNRKLVLLGAGKKGKWIAKYLINHSIPFVWATNNHKKIGLKIYDIILQNEHLVISDKNAQFVITIANPDEQQKLKTQFSNSNSSPLKDYFFFC